MASVIVGFTIRGFPFEENLEKSQVRYTASFRDSKCVPSEWEPDALLLCYLPWRCSCREVHYTLFCSSVPVPSAFWVLIEAGVMTAPLLFTLQSRGTLLVLYENTTQCWVANTFYADEFAWSGRNSNGSLQPDCTVL